MSSWPDEHEMLQRILHEGYETGIWSHVKKHRILGRLTTKGQYKASIIAFLPLTSLFISFIFLEDE